MLSVKRLVKHFGGVAALNGVSLEVRPGSIAGLIGPNGSGKTTLINVVTGIYSPDGGEVLYEGRSITGEPPHRIAAHGIARTFQNIRLFGELSVLENVMIGYHLRFRSRFHDVLLRSGRMRREEREARAAALERLEALGLLEYAEARAGALSYGDRRRVEIARALMAGPRLLLLDEPAAGMTRAEKERLLELIGRVRDGGVTVLLIEHDMEMVMRLCEEIVVLNFGQEIAVGPPERVKTHPAVIEAYLGEESA